jgi:putative nucleotidyltransferase with HDIG domain
LASDNTSIAEIERIISRDVAMAAKILQLANSAFLGARGHVSSLSHALSLMGAEIIRSLMLSIHVFSQFDRHSHAAAYVPALWDHSMEVAWLARRIAASETGSRAVQEESFTTGLLHDVGKIVLLAEMPQEYRRVMERVEDDKRSYRELETVFVGCSHDQIGAYLMAIWGLPESIVHAVGSHHAVAGASIAQFSPLTAVCFADFIASQSDSSPLNHDLEPETHSFSSPEFSPKEPLWRGFFDEYRLSRAK